MSITYDTIGLGGGYSNRPGQFHRLSNYPKTRLEWFNTNNFYVPLPSWAGGQNLGFGNSGRDAIVSPGRVNFSTSLYKSFAIVGSAHFDLRFESFNTFNHTQWSGVSTSLGSGNYGQVTGNQLPRNLELGGKFVF
jgi:hypothetical protein